jgi:predicted TIM-barrel fold metal-dependent hydrolase
MAVQIATRIIDGDGHIYEDLPAILSHLEEPYRTLIPRGGSVFPPLDHQHSARAMDTPPTRDGRKIPGPDGWLDFLRDSGIEWTVLYPSYALSYGRIVSVDYAVAICKAYNDWLHATYVQRDSRFKGMGLIPMQHPAEAAKELRRVVTELGFLGAMLPSNGLALPLGSRSYWSVYEEANRLGCCLAVHGGCHDRFGMDHMNMFVPIHALGHPWGLTISCADMLYNGLFERFPKLRVAYLEGGLAWLVFLLERLHASHETHFQYVPPGEYGIREGQDPAAYIKALIAEDRLYVGIEAEEITLPFTTKLVGNRAFMYSSDFPHEVTLESCRRDIGELMESDELTAEDKSAILYRNAERFYQLKP